MRRLDFVNMHIFVLFHLHARLQDTVLDFLYASFPPVIINARCSIECFKEACN